MFEVWFDARTNPPSRGMFSIPVHSRRVMRCMTGYKVVITLEYIGSTFSVISGRDTTTQVSFDLLRCVGLASPPAAARRPSEAI